MRRLLKWLGYVVGAAIIVVLALITTTWVMASQRMAKSYPTEVESIAIPSDEASLTRGEHLVRAVGKCADCHGQSLEGQTVMDAAVFMRLTAPNLTTGKNGAGVHYTDDDWVRSIRYGVRPDGKPLIFMPSDAYSGFSDTDLGAIIAYLRTIPALDMPVQPVRSVGPMARIASVIGDFPLLPAELVDRSRPRVVQVSATVTAEYGRYLAETGGCMSCHMQTLEGGAKVQGVPVPNLTPGGPMGSWTEADFFRLIRAGTRPDGRVLNEAMPWKAMATLTDDEIRAMWLYIRSIPAVPARN